MHLQYLAILLVTGLTVAGYVTLHCALASQGKVRAAGKILAGWAFLLAVVVVVIAITMPFHRGDSHHRYHSGYHSKYHGDFERKTGAMGPPAEGERPMPGAIAPPPSHPHHPRNNHPSY